MLLLFVWVGFHLVSRFSIAQAMTAWDVAALRFAGAFLTVLPIVLWRGPPRIAPERALAVLVFAGFGFPLFAFAGYRCAPAAHGATVMAAGLPVGTALLGLAFGLGRIGGRRALSLCVVVAGSVLLAAAKRRRVAGRLEGRPALPRRRAVWSIYTVLVQRWRLPALDSMLAIGLAAAPVYLPVWWLVLPSTIGEASVGRGRLPGRVPGRLRGRPGRPALHQGRDADRARADHHDRRRRAGPGGAGRLAAAGRGACRRSACWRCCWCRRAWCSAWRARPPRAR